MIFWAHKSALSTPMGLSLIEDSSTDEVTAILIADWGNSRIRKLDVSTWIITTIAVAGSLTHSMCFMISHMAIFTSRTLITIA